MENYSQVYTTTLLTSYVMSQYAQNESELSKYVDKCLLDKKLQDIQLKVLSSEELTESDYVRISDCISEKKSDVFPVLAFIVGFVIVFFISFVVYAIFL